MHKNLPVDLVLVRHGQSEGNLANQLPQKQNVWDSPFRDRHNSLYRLTDTGREQSRIAGEWIKANIGKNFDKYLTSEYLRAMETAAALRLPNAKWGCEFYLRERDRGVLAHMSREERIEIHSEELKRQDRDSFYFQPSGGESIANLCLRVDRVLDSLSVTASGLRVVIVCHGGVIKAFKALIERVRQHKTSRNKVHNGQIIWFSRRDPRTGHVHQTYRWSRSVCPWNLKLSLSSANWRKIVTATYTNDELLQTVYQVPQLINAPLDLPCDAQDLDSSPDAPALLKEVTPDSHEKSKKERLFSNFEDVKPAPIDLSSPVALLDAEWEFNSEDDDAVM